LENCPSGQASAYAEHSMGAADLRSSKQDGTLLD
jgi:hypothetical protein